MASVKDNIVSLDSVYKNINTTIDKNIDLLKEATKAVENYNKTISLIPSEYRKTLEDLANKNKSLQETQAKLAEIEKKLEEIRKRANNTSRERVARTSEEIVNQRALAQASDRQARATSSLAGAMANLNARHQQARKTLQDLIASQTASTAQIRRAQREYDALDRRVVHANNAVRQFNYNVGNYPRQAVASIRSLMSAFGLFGGVYLFATAVKQAFTTVRDFDKANADLAATMGKSRKEISALTEDQKRLGASTKFTATEVAGLQKEYAKLGFSQTEILNATEATLSLAAAVETDLANASMVAGSTLRGFGLDASEMGRVVDVMAKSFTSSALDIENFRESMKYVAPIAKASGVSIEFTTAMLGKLADAGIKGSQAGTSLRRILAEMAKTGKPASQALDEVAKSGISVNDAMDEVGRTAQTALLVLSKSKNGIDDLAKSLDNAAGSAKAMADIQLDSLQGKITLLTSAWDGFILSLEDGSGSGGAAVGRLIDNFTELLNKLSLLEEMSNKSGKFFFNNWKKGVDSLVPKETLDAVAYFNSELEKTNKIAESQLKSIQKYESNLKKLGGSNFFNNNAVASEQKLLDEATKKYNATLSARNFLETSIKEKQAERLRLESEFITAFTLRNKQVSQSVALDYAKIKTDAQLKREIGLLTLVEDKDTKATDKNKKAKEEHFLAEMNSRDAFEKNISAIEKQLKSTSKLNPVYAVLEFQLKMLKDAYKALYDEQEKGVDLQYGTIQYYENEIKLIKEKQELVTDNDDYSNYERQIGFYETLINRIKGVAEETKKAKTEQEEFSESFRKGFVDDFVSNSGFDKLFYLIDNFEMLKESGVDTALAISEAFQQAFNTISEASQANYEAEFERLETQKDFAIEMAGGSVTAKEEIERQYEERRKAIARRKAESDKKLAIFNAVINTAQAVTSALAEYDYFSAILFGVLGAAQIALISSQQIPQFWKGTENAPEGLAWTQEKGAEVITDKKGNVKSLGSDKGAQLTYLSKGDKVYKSHEDYINKVLSKNGIAELGSYMNFAPKTEIINNGITKEDLEQNFSKLASVIKNKEGVSISIDEKGFRKSKGNTEFINSRLNIKSRTV